MKTKMIEYLTNLRSTILLAFEALEKKSTFEKEKWAYKEKGGGEIALLRGSVFEKAAVNISCIEGSLFPLKEEGKSGPFFATGVSLITHMQNPFAPTVHMNLRYLETEEESWIGGGYDLTPMGFPFEEDTLHFHTVAKNSLDPIDPSFYTTFSKNASEYFYIPHYKKERGVGGIFFDHFNTGNKEKDFQMVQSIGDNFLEAILPIYKKRCVTPFTVNEKTIQNTQRAHYVEFNLLYDRGTKFGFKSEGNPKAILCSMPPIAHW